MPENSKSTTTTAAAAEALARLKQLEHDESKLEENTQEINTLSSTLLKYANEGTEKLKGANAEEINKILHAIMLLLKEQQKFPDEQDKEEPGDKKEQEKKVDETFNKQCKIVDSLKELVSAVQDEKSKSPDSALTGIAESLYETVSSMKECWPKLTTKEKAKVSVGLTTLIAGTALLIAALIPPGLGAIVLAAASVIIGIGKFVCKKVLQSHKEKAEKAELTEKNKQGTNPLEKAIRNLDAHKKTTTELSKEAEEALARKRSSSVSLSKKVPETTNRDLKTNKAKPSKRPPAGQKLKKD